MSTASWDTYTELIKICGEIKSLLQKDPSPDEMKAALISIKENLTSCIIDLGNENHWS